MIPWFPRILRQAPLDMFSLLLIGEGFGSDVDALNACLNGWHQATTVTPLNIFADGCAGANAIGVYIETTLNLGVTQTGKTLSIPASGMQALDDYLNLTSTVVTMSDGTSYPASKVWPSFGRTGEFGSLIAMVVAPAGNTPGPAELYQVSLSEGYTRPIVAVVATGDSWHKVLARAVAQTYSALGDEYELDGSDFAQVPDTFWVPQTNILYVTAYQRDQLAQSSPPNPVTLIGQQNFPASWGVNFGSTLAVWPHFSDTTNPPPAQAPNARVQLVEGAGSYRKGAYRCDFDCLMRRKPNSAAMPIQDHIGFCHACEQAIRTSVLGTPDAKAFKHLPKLKNQRLDYDKASWTTAAVDIASTTFPMPVTAMPVSGAPTWRFNVDVNSADGFKITDVKLQDRPGDPYQTADNVCALIAFTDLWVALDGGQAEPLNPANAFANTADPPRLEQAANNLPSDPSLAGVKLTLTWAHSSGWRIQAAFSLTVKDKRNDFDPGGAAEACKFFPQIAMRCIQPRKGSGKLPKVTGLGGSIVLLTNNVIPVGTNVPGPLAMMANGMLSASLFVDSNNSDFDNGYALAPAPVAGLAGSYLGGIVPAAPFGIWKGDWQSGRKLAGVINPTFLVYLLAGSTARVAHLAVGYPGLPHWSWLFDYCWPNFSGSKQFTAVYRAGETTSGGHQNIVRISDPPIAWPPAASQTGTPKAARMTVRKLPRQGAFDSIHVNASMMQDSQGRDIVAAPFCADLCLHLHWRWGTNTLVGAIPSRLYAYRGWGDGSGNAGAGMIPGYPLIPPNQHLDITAAVDTAMDQTQITYQVSVGQPDVGRWQVFLEQGVGFAFTYNGLAIPQVGLLAGGVVALKFGPPPLTSFENWVTNLQGLKQTNPAEFDQNVRLLFMDIYGCIRWYDTTADNVQPSTQQIPGWAGGTVTLPPGLEDL